MTFSVARALPGLGTLLSLIPLLACLQVQVYEDEGPTLGAS